MEEQIPKTDSQPVDTQDPNSQIEPNTNPILQPQQDKPKKQWVWILVAVLVIAAGVGAYFLYKKHNKVQPSQSNTTQTTQTSDKQTTSVSLVHLLYTSTTPPGAQNSEDGPTLTAEGHYLELNAKGTLVFDGKTVTTGVDPSTKVGDAVLSKNGLHYAYLLTPVNGTNTSDVYIDGKKVGPLVNSGLIAVSNDGKSYLNVREMSKITPTSYNTGIHQEAIQRNGTDTIVTSDYGFLGEDYSGDLKNVLSQSRNYGAGHTYYFNSQKLNNCSYTWSGNNPNAPQSQAVLSQDGEHSLCAVYHLGSAPSGSDLVYQMNDLQVFEDDKSVLNITKPIAADQVITFGYSTAGQWMLLLSRGNVVTQGSVTSISKLFPGLSAADLSAANSNQVRLTYASPTKYALYLPDTHKILVKGLTLGKLPDLSAEQVNGIEYTSAASTLYVYDAK